MKFQRLFEPITFANIKIRNRIAMPAMHLGLAQNGNPTETALDFYERRARGGVGLITVGLCNTWKHESSTLKGALELATDNNIPSMSLLAKRIQKHGSVPAVQLTPLCGYNRPDWHPDPSQIKTIIDSIGMAAKRAQAAGFHYVELMLSGGSLLSHFLSPAHNTWNITGYSNTKQDRLRAPLEAIAAIQKHLGTDYPIVVRMHGHEFLETGYGLEEAQQIAVAFEQAGVAGINVTGAGHRTTLPQITSQTPFGSFTYLAKNIADAVSIPILAGGRIRTPKEAHTALAESNAELVNLGRALIVDPDWPTKARDDNTDTAITCMACCACLDQAFTNKPIVCSLNPEAGIPKISHATTSPASTTPRVLVVGAGPAGLQAAWTIHQYGYPVTLREAAPELGGRWKMVSELRGREDLRESLAGSISRLVQSGIPIETKCHVTPEDVREFHPNLLVLAIGAVPRHIHIPGQESHPNAMHVERVLGGPTKIGDNIAIIGGNGAGVELAIHLAQKGRPNTQMLGYLGQYGESPWLAEALKYKPQRKITILKRRGFAGKGLGRSVRWTMMKEIEKLDIRVIDRCTYNHIVPQGVHIHNGRSKKDELIVADTIIYATGYQPDEQTIQRFDGSAPGILTVGDATRVSNIGSAITHSFSTISRYFEESNQIPIRQNRD